jgi:hypothetical protein
MTIGDDQAIGREDEAGTSAAVTTPAHVALDGESHHGGADRLRNTCNRLRVRVDQCRVA